MASVKVRLLEKIPKCPTKPGYTRMVSPSLATRWVAAGLAEYVGEPQHAPPAKNETVMMVPARDICGCGYVPRDVADRANHAADCDRASRGKVRLNIGCGKDTRKGFVNIDCRKLPGVDVVADATDLSGLGLGPADHILAIDVIEHFPQALAPQVLRGWVDLLKPGGTLELQCPDVRHAAEIAYSDEWLVELLYGGEEYEENYHKAGFTLATMTQLLEGLGMRVTYTEQTQAGNLRLKAEKAA